MCIQGVLSTHNDQGGIIMLSSQLRKLIRNDKGRPRAQVSKL